MTETTEEIKPMVENKSMLERWEETKPPVDYQVIGSKKWAKMAMFILSYPLTNELIDEWMYKKYEASNPLRKQLSYFQKDLLKFRERLYKYPEHTQKQLKALKKHGGN
jgi:hypothetical protein